MSRVSLTKALLQLGRLGCLEMPLSGAKSHLPASQFLATRKEGPKKLHLSTHQLPPRDRHVFVPTAKVRGSGKSTKLQTGLACKPAQSIQHVNK